MRRTWILLAAVLALSACGGQPIEPTRGGPAGSTLGQASQPRAPIVPVAHPAPVAATPLPDGVALS